jgi:hypothetical protein
MQHLQRACQGLVGYSKQVNFENIDGWNWLEKWGGGKGAAPALWLQLQEDSWYDNYLEKLLLSHIDQTTYLKPLLIFPLLVYPHEL